MANRRIPKPGKQSDGENKTGVWLVLMSIFIVELFFYTWCRVQCTQIGYEISRFEVVQKDLVARQEGLKIELARLKSPERIEKIAREQLDLVRPKPEQIIFVE
jgi:cell division protein FtsL